MRTVVLKGGPADGEVINVDDGMTEFKVVAITEKLSVVADINVVPATEDRMKYYLYRQRAQGEHIFHYCQ